MSANYGGGCPQVKTRIPPDSRLGLLPTSVGWLCHIWYPSRRMPHETVIVWTACPDRHVAETIARHLVDQRLAACATMLPGATSIGPTQRSRVSSMKRRNPRTRRSAAVPFERACFQARSTPQVQHEGTATLELKSRVCPPPLAGACVDTRRDSLYFAPVHERGAAKTL
jgi:hypothetical protein